MIIMCFCAAQYLYKPPYTYYKYSLTSGRLYTVYMDQYVRYLNEKTLLETHFFLLGLQKIILRENSIKYVEKT